MAVTHEELNPAPAAPENSDELLVVDEPEGTEEYGGYAPPKGAFLFVLVMLVGYAIYWLLTYAEIVIARNGS